MTSLMAVSVAVIAACCLVGVDLVGRFLARAERALGRMEELSRALGEELRQAVRSGDKVLEEARRLTEDGRRSLHELDGVLGRARATLDAAAFTVHLVTRRVGPPLITLASLAKGASEVVSAFVEQHTGSSKGA